MSDAATTGSDSYRRAAVARTRCNNCSAPSHATRRAQYCPIRRSGTGLCVIR